MVIERLLMVLCSGLKNMREKCEYVTTFYGSYSSESVNKNKEAILKTVDLLGRPDGIWGV